MLSEQLEKLIKNATSIALQHKHEYVNFEHLLLALLDDDDVQEVFLEKNINIQIVRKKLINYIQNNLQDLVVNSLLKPSPISSLQRLIQRAILHAKSMKIKSVSNINIMAELFYEHDSYALTCLKEVEINKQDFLDYLYISSTTASESEKHTSVQNMLNFVSEKISSSKIEDSSASDKKSLLEKHCANLNEKAANKEIDCLIGRDNEINRTIEILCRRRKNNVILVGEPGVGKTAIAEGMAYKILLKEVPSVLQNMIIYALDLGSIIAGTKFRGEFEGRIKSLVDELTNSQNAILFIDEIHTLVGAGSTANGTMDASNLLKPALTKGLFRCIGATTFKEYRNQFEQDMALSRRFQKVVINEPNEEATLEILKGLKNKYEEYHNVIYDDAALKSAISLSQKYLSDRKLPDKAIDLIDEAGSYSNMNHQLVRNAVINAKDIERLIANIIKIPVEQLSSEALSDIKNLDKKLKEHIFAQDEAIDILCSNVKMSKVGLRKTSRPIGCYMFAGGTGVGKTELAKQFAHYNHMKLLKFDMSEFIEANSISKLIGSSPGYIGSDKAGMLTDSVDKNPYSVVLFDEIEKANSEILNILLQIMDDGKLTDNLGKPIDFTNSIIIMTTNIIANEKSYNMGFSGPEISGQGDDSRKMSAFEAHFSPEFRSRLDKIILFNPIDNAVEKIIEKNLQELFEQLLKKEVILNYNSKLVKYFKQEHFSKTSGARGLSQAIDVCIKQNIAEEILFGKLKNGGRVLIDVNSKNQIIFDFKTNEIIKRDQIEMKLC
ncbi:MAG TPA: AAA family ATPase [Candidatus Megaira endosymbiont of Nemacystus decipiens]|nr:AAA family ATPase [Candidatus Megaera endosymbiont of Nemacystus decipiens]